MPNTHEEIRSRLNYDSETGLFTRKGARRNAKDGSVGTKRADGRLRICVANRLYYAHRLAWFYVHGEWPEGEVDHIDGNPLNNSIGNLRCANRAENMQNQRHARSDSTTGLLGVQRRPCGTRFAAEIRKNGVRKFLGNFDTPEEAHHAYMTAKRQIHEFCSI